jgi:tRNA A-37 threonylcarbamoyl transferase component Bud32
MSDGMNTGATGLPGKIADYRPSRYIGGSRLATVYLAQDERMGRTVALKVFAPSMTGEGAFRTRFLRESEAAVTVGHPNILPVYEVGDTGQNLFTAMRFAQGGDAGSLLRSAGPLPPAGALNIIAHVASALDAAHAHGLVHGDVKPSNMLLDSGDGLGAAGPGAGQVFLSDFGIGLSLPPSGAAPAGQDLEAPSYDYTAPEQAAGQPADGRADLYSLACAGYELLCGAPPFGRDQGMTARYAHIYARPPTATAMRPDLPSDVDIVLATALAKAPADRYSRCGEFAEALRAALRLSAGPARAAPATQGGPALPSGPATAAAATQGGPARPSPPATAALGQVSPAASTAGRPERGAQPARPFVPTLVGADVVYPMAGSNGSQPAPGTNGTQPAQQRLPSTGRSSPRNRPVPPQPQANAAGGPFGPYPGPDDPFPGDDERYPGPGQPYAAPGGVYIGPPGPARGPGQQYQAPGPPAGSADQYAQTEQFPSEQRQQPYSEPEESFFDRAGWFREPQQADQDQGQQGWYGGPGEQYGGGPGLPPGPRRRSGGKRLVLAATAATVAIIVILVAVLLSRQPGGHPSSLLPSRPGSPSVSPPPAPTSASGQATAINKVLSSSATARKSLPGAVSDVLQCSNLSNAISQIQGVVDQRNNEVTTASALSVSALTNGATVKSGLVAALRSSLTADQDYLSWAQQESSSCQPNAQTSAYQAAVSADSQAAAAKQTFVGVWNPVARTYGLPTQSATSF